ncbi:glycosyltransferase [Modestobacter sp. VKM Ac-2985]|uniref:glycosyltransferase n=1 Tax=Modestobacter sp. VKM Ac-2985 TaxID=3004139 RepID=UPI0022AB61F7|nr:glycosyltransferase [Modestobacter sp. VKM Ac-2985]MCZ2836434.1 glycosyltransferase [Modestobacter sp. VKM Ac-2985]
MTPAAVEPVGEGRPSPTGLPDPGVLGVVVVNYGSAALLERNLADATAVGPAVRVVVVDNLSTSRERQAVTTLAAARGWDLVAAAGNDGFGAASNAGAARARELGCTSYCFLNPDAVVTAEVLAALRAASSADPTAVIAPRLTDSAGHTVFEGSLVSLTDGRIRSPHSTSPFRRGPVEQWLTGACLVVHAELFDRIGGFAEDYFLYWEDVDLSHRALAAGGHLVVRHDLVAVHDEGGTQGERRGPAKSALYYRYNCRNRLLFAARNLDRRAVLQYLLSTPAVSWEVLMRGGRRQLLHSPALLTAAVRGSLAGVWLALLALLVGPAPAGRRPAVLVAHPGAELYGSDRVLLESVAGLVAGADVTVVLPGPGPLVAELEARGAQVRTCRMPVLRRSALRPRGACQLLADAARGLVPALALLRRHGRSGVYVNTLTIPSWLVLARLLRRPTVCHVHEAERGTPWLFRWVTAQPLRLADRVVVNSRTTAAVLTEVAPSLRERSVVVLNGVTGPATPVPPRTRLTGAVRLAFVGRLSPRKGPQVAVEALAELLSRGTDARLVLLGSVFPGYEWFEAALREDVRRRGLEDRVEFRGFRPDVWSTLAECDLLLVPSQTDESFGNTAVEGVLAARPVVVSDIAGLVEATTGLTSTQVVPAADAGSWADAVQRVVDGWPVCSAAAVADAQEARRRHAPARQQAEVAALVDGLPPRARR